MALPVSPEVGNFDDEDPTIDHKMLNYAEND